MGDEQRAATRTPGVVMQSLHYAQAVGRWIVGGAALRAEVDVQRIFQTHCAVCEYFNARRQTCKICGCRVRDRGGALVNKIRMASEHCPKGRW